MKPTLHLFVKVPVAGRVKTRLGRDIGLTAAAWWFRHHCGALIRSLAVDPRWHTVLSVAPDREGMAFRGWPGSIARMPQGRGDLGARMARALAQPGPRIILGADIPGIGPDHIARGFGMLGRADAVFGPAPDGGYWLIGMKHPPRRLFEGVRWSSEHTLSDTLATLPEGARIEYLDTLRDVDTLSDLEALKGGR